METAVATTRWWKGNYATTSILKLADIPINVKHSANFSEL